jgi:predicted GNAT family acetyltransferase
MSQQLTRHPSAAAFLAAAGPFLAEREAEHNLLLGLCVELERDPHTFGPDDPYFATVADGGQVVAAALMTPPHNLTLSLATPGALALIADDLATDWPALPGVAGPAEQARTFAEHWRARTGAAVHQHMALRIYQLTAVTPAARAPGRLRVATDADRSLVEAWLAGFQQDAAGDAHPDPARIRRATDRWLAGGSRTLYLWEDGQPVSMAGVAGPTPHGIRIGAVYTPPALRRRGYASAVVAAASQAQLDAGRTFCFLYTDLANPTSNHIYQEIGYRPVCDVTEYRFAAHGSVP